MPSVELHRLAPDEWRVWRELRLRALAEAPYAFSSTLSEWSGNRDTETRWRDRLTSVPLNLVASLGGEAVGMASATSPQGGEVELISMWVAPDSRRSGVATALIEAIGEWALAEGAIRVALDVRDDNMSAIDLYTACGFVDVGRSHNSGPDSPERRMVRLLR
jgi:ribosomal protein S18 acetylase RimI-like enzyme